MNSPNSRLCSVCSEPRPRGCILTCGRSSCLLQVSSADYDRAYAVLHGVDVTEAAAAERFERALG